MAAYAPPKELLSIYNPLVFQLPISNDIRDYLLDNFIPETGGTIIGRLNITTKMWFISSATQLPEATGNVISIPANTTVYIIGDVNLAGKRLNFLGNCSIIGNSSEVSSLSSTGLPTGESLLTSTFTLPIRNITFGCPTDCSVLSLAGDGTNGLDLFAVNFGSTSLVCGSIGSVEDYSNAIITECASLNTTAGIVFTGSISTIGINNSFFADLNSNSSQITLNDCTVLRRFRMDNSSLIVGAGKTGITVSGTTTFPVESFILSTVNFSGSGTFLTGLLPTSNSANISNTIGIQNSNKFGFITMTGNSTATTITTVDTYVKMAGTTALESITQKFTQPITNRMTYVGAIDAIFRIIISMTLTSGNNNVIAVTIFKNGSASSAVLTTTTDGGGRVENVTLQSVIELVENDYLEIFVKNTSGTTNITVVDISWIVSLV